MTAVCPITGSAEEVVALAPMDRLHLPAGKAFVTHWATGETGEPELVLFYRDKEICFDDPRFFAFGEALVRQKRFLAAEALGWGEGYGWTEIAPMLEYLLAEEILFRDADNRESKGGLIGECPSPLPPATETQVFDWNDCAAITEKLTGQPLALEHLEMIVPPYRFAHLALDGDGRQVGEANVFPPALRLDIPTRWAQCNYGGSRFQAGKPMNVTALKAMRSHWGAMMAILLRVRDAYLSRFPEAEGNWTVGHVERLTTCVLGLANYQLMRRDRPASVLHPAISSAYRVTDGVRMVTHQMMFIPTGEGAWHPDQPVTGADIHDYAERNFSFHSDHGVCAGPRLMIEEFLGVLIDGRAPTSAAAVIGDDAILAALADLEPAIDYALLGLQVHAVTYSLWPEMGRAYAAIADHAAALAEAGNAAAIALQPRLAEQIRRLTGATYFGTEQYRTLRLAAYGDMFAQSARGLDGAPPATALAELLTVMRDAADTELCAALDARVADHFAPRDAAEARHVAGIAYEIFRFHKGIQKRIVEGQKIQDRINALLLRAPAMTCLSGRQFWIAKELVGSSDGSLEALPDFLADVMNIAIRVEAGFMELNHGGTPGTANN